MSAITSCIPFLPPSKERTASRFAEPVPFSALPSRALEAIIRYTRGVAQLSLVNKAFHSAAKTPAEQCLTSLNTSQEPVIQQALAALKPLPPSTSSLTRMKVFYNALRSLGYDIEFTCSSTYIENAIVNVREQAVLALIPFLAKSIDRPLPKEGIVAARRWLTTHSALIAGITILNLHQREIPRPSHLSDEVMGLLTNLLALDLKGFRSITHLPDSLWSLTQLKSIDITDTGIQKLSSKIGNLINLNTLHADRTKLTELPEEVGSLPRLTWLTAPFERMKNVSKKIIYHKSQYISGDNKVYRHRWYGPLVLALKEALSILRAGLCCLRDILCSIGSFLISPDFLTVLGVVLLVGFYIAMVVVLPLLAV